MDDFDVALSISILREDNTTIEGNQILRKIFFYRHQGLTEIDHEDQIQLLQIRVSPVLNSRINLYIASKY